MCKYFAETRRKKRSFAAKNETAFDDCYSRFSQLLNVGFKATNWILACMNVQFLFDVFGMI